MPLLQQVNQRARDRVSAGLRFSHGAAQLTVCQELARLLSKWFPTEYAERLAEVRPPQNEWMPIFVCSLSMPFTITPLHIFEPRYRLMMRRCVETNQRFGMCLPTEDGGFAEKGTVLLIDDFQQLPDGRCLINTTGIYRFHVLERSVLDGYNIALIRPFEEDASGFPTSSRFRDKALEMDEKITTLARTRGFRDLERVAGPRPDKESPDFAAHMSFYAAQVGIFFGASEYHPRTWEWVFKEPEEERWQLLQTCLNKLHADL